MTISQLHIFSKKRDATAAMKGYEFQHLKTLESWLLNRVNNTDEIIYCDFEEDIFSRNLGKETSTFRQIKLYSTNFSFSSDAIQETIANFFMLYVKGEYLMDEVTFSFETNASIVEKIIKGNDADLLQAWAKDQGALKGAVLDKVRERVKQIIGAYIQKEYDARIKDTEAKPELQKARNLFENITDEVLDKFLQLIRWKFEGIEPNVAIQAQLAAINALIEKLPLPIHESNEVSMALLYREIVNRSIQDDPEDRKVTNALMDLILLQTGDKKDKWYAELYAKWMHAGDIKTFNAGEYYEIINAVSYSRMNFHKSGHKEVWQKFLFNYVNTVESEIYYKRKAIYELCFLLLSPDPQTGHSVSSLQGQEDLIRYYFNNWEHRNNLSDIQDDITLLQIILAQSVIKRVAIEEKEIARWKSVILTFLEEELKKPKTPDEKCMLLELRGGFELHTVMDKSEAAIEQGIGYYRQILPLLNQAHLYSVSPLFDQLRAILGLLIGFGREPKAITAIEAFLEELQDAAVQSGNRHPAAKSLVSRGVGYLEAGGLFNLLQALNCFHKAKELWYLEHTKEGYILSLLNLSQVYSVLRMNIAAKYYALCAVWSTWHFNDKSLFHRLSQGMGLLFAANFKQGAWVSAIDNFLLFLKTRDEFLAGGWAGDDDKLFEKTLPDMAFMITSSKKLSPQLIHYINHLTGQWGDLWTVFLAPMTEELEKLLSEDKKIIDAARRQVVYEPLNDVGKERTIAFNALNIDWYFYFENTHQMNAIGEEFISAVQIFLCEIARVDKTILNGNKTVTVHLKKGEGYQSPLKHEQRDEWQVMIPAFDSKEQAKISFHYANIGTAIKSILFSLSPLTKEAFNDFFYKTLHEKEKVAQKALCTNTYQKVYQNAISEEDFNKSQRAGFNPLPPHLVFPVLPPLLNN
jgi:hypothetical protein